mmetsp:Transcript_57715/g.134996  ORF Transcript_57715/g.134996 Transcript_57715/m.134996 type:complete len:126 (-) Transcript_57715:234-611(-)
MGCAQSSQAKAVTETKDTSEQPSAEGTLLAPPPGADVKAAAPAEEAANEANGEPTPEEPQQDAKKEDEEPPVTAAAETTPGNGSPQKAAESDPREVSVEAGTEGKASEKRGFFDFCCGPPAPVME